MRSRLERMKKVARMLRAYEPLILNWFRGRGEISTGAVEGLYNKIRVVTRRSYGFRTFEAMEVPLYHSSKRGYPIENIVALLDEPGMTVEETIERILSTRERKPNQADERGFFPPARPTVPSQMSAGCPLQDARPNTFCGFAPGDGAA